MPPDIYEQINTKGKRFRGIRLRRYYAETSILIITIPTLLHERLHAEIYRAYEHKLARLGFQDSWAIIASTTLRRLGHPRGDGGEADSAGGPRPERSGNGGWPTLVIEAGDSESINRLRQDMNWWFDASNHQVKIVLLTKFHHGKKELCLEKWEETWETRPGPTLTRSTEAAADASQRVLTPTKKQDITITRDSSKSPPDYIVTRGALELEFSLLFNRASRADRGEVDFVWSADEMKVYAAHVWEAVQ